jgi:hypothetical protein
VRNLHGRRVGLPTPASHKRLMASVHGVAAMLQFLYLSEFDQISVLDQGGEGACTGFAMIEVAGHTYLKQDGVWRRLSAQFSYNMSRMEEGTPLSEDSGCAIPDVVHGFEVRGICREELFPTVDDGKQLKVDPPLEAKADALNYRGLLSFHLPDDERVTDCLAQGFAVTVGISCPDNMMAPYAAQTGEVAYPEQGEKMVGGHDIVIIGRDPDKVIGGRKGCYRFRNSWGAGWGAGGDGWLPVDFVTDGLASDGYTVRAVSG